MSGGEVEEVVRSAVPIADLSIIDESIDQGPERLKEAVQKVRPADLGRDASGLFIYLTIAHLMVAQLHGG